MNLDSTLAGPVFFCLVNRLETLEAGVGIEPASTALQAAA